MRPPLLALPLLTPISAVLQLVAEFCMMGLWPLLIALQCAAVLGHRPARFCPPLGAFLLLSAGLGCFALAPV